MSLEFLLCSRTNKSELSQEKKSEQWMDTRIVAFDQMAILITLQIPLLCAWIKSQFLESMRKNWFLYPLYYCRCHLALACSCIMTPCDRSLGTNVVETLQRHGISTVRVLSGRQGQAYFQVLTKFRESWPWPITSDPYQLLNLNQRQMPALIYDTQAGTHPARPTVIGLPFFW